MFFRIDTQKVFAIVLNDESFFPKVKGMGKHVRKAIMLRCYWKFTSEYGFYMMPAINNINLF